jgi:hypothetical protein
MAHRYVLKLSPAGVEAKILNTTVVKREIDLAILENLFYSAANTCKSSRDIHLCKDFADQVKNITDEATIELDDADKTNLEKGIEATVNQRPLSWYVSDLWAQFDKLEPVVEKK